METLVLNFKNREDLKLVRELASRLNAEVETSSAAERRKNLQKSKFQSEEEFRSLAGIAKGQLISEDHLRSLSWKKRG